MAKTKKRWFKVLAPKLFKEMEVGESPAYEPKELEGRTMKVNLSTLTNNIRKQNTVVSLTVDKMEGDRAKTNVLGLEVTPSSIKRMIRKRRSRLDQTIKAITKDKKIMTIKIILVTRNVVKGSVYTTLQNESKRIILKKMANSRYDEIVEQIISNQLQKDIKNKLKKTYPIKICEVKAFKEERNLKTTEIRKIKAGLSKDKGKEMPKKEEPKEEVPENPKDSEDFGEEKSQDSKEESAEKKE